MINAIRNSVNSVLQALQFRIDATYFILDKPSFDYQPLPWVGIKNASIRGEATVARWLAISPHISINSISLKDIGCCVGYFCHSAAIERGMITIGIDSDARFIRIANYVKRKICNVNQIFYEFLVTPNSASVLPKTDTTILFSIWHHWVLHYGLAEATKMLLEVWESTNNELFFESGEDEVAEEFNLPFSEHGAVWLERYLNENLSNSSVIKIGKFQAGNYKHYKKNSHFRTVFLIKKVS